MPTKGGEDAQCLQLPQAHLSPSTNPAEKGSHESCLHETHSSCTPAKQEATGKPASTRTNNRKTISRGVPDLILKLWQMHCSGKGQGSPKGAVGYLYSRYQVSPSLPPAPAEAAPPIYLFIFNDSLVIFNPSQPKQALNPIGIHCWVDVTEKGNSTELINTCG